MKIKCADSDEEDGDDAHLVRTHTRQDNKCSESQNKEKINQSEILKINKRSISIV